MQAPIGDSRTRKDTILDESWTEDYTALWIGLPRCVSCDRRMRPINAPAPEWPQTISRATKRICQSCYRLHGGTEKTMPKPAVRDENPDLRDVADGWSANEWAVARSICARYDAESARELLSCMGLLDPNRWQFLRSGTAV